MVKNVGGQRKLRISVNKVFSQTTLSGSVYTGTKLSSPFIPFFSPFHGCTDRMEADLTPFVLLKFKDTVIFFCICRPIYMQVEKPSVHLQQQFGELIIS